MRLFNTLSRKVEVFKPADGKAVSLYTCGPTVYNYYHIGNLRNAVFNDTLRRTLEASGLPVKHVMNITDVGHLVSDADEGEDKLETGAKREGKTVWEVAEHYTKAFKDDMAAMNVLAPNHYKSPKYHDSYARATEFIDVQIKLVQLLLDKGFAYQTEQAIYFDVSKLPDYGELTGQKLSEKEVGARQEVITDNNKRSPHDFAVWFFATGHFADHTMQWPSPWGNGFPGWHLECSAIIHDLLGDPIDIHTGGVDHIGTHHPNEMAQTQAAFGHPLAHFWVHNEFVLVDGQKMAKSKGNAYTLKDVNAKGFSPADYRLLGLQAHYRSELNFSWENLAAAHQRLSSYQQLADLKWQTTKHGISEADLANAKAKILEHLQNDLNTPEALAVLSHLTKQAEDQGLATSQDHMQSFLDFIDSVLALGLSQRPDVTSDQKDILSKRAKARISQDWAEADNLRQKLSAAEIGVRDTAHGQVWFRTN